MGVTTAAVPHDVFVAGADWWGARFGDADRVGFSAAFLPALLKSCRLEPAPGDAALSLDELRVVAKYCVADAAWQHDAISRADFIHFLARFGPLEVCAQRLVDSLTAHRELVPWFHGTVTRAEAERLLLVPAATSPPLEDGAFLVRFSDSQPSRFCVSYLKVHATGPHAGRREVRNVLVENAGHVGFVLTDSRTKAYASIRSFIQRTAARLKHGISSALARRCNLELAAVRARQDLASNSYTTFSTDSLGATSTSSPSSPTFKSQRTAPSSLLFATSPPAGPELLLRFGNNQEEHLHHEREDENYSGFAKSSFLSQPLSVKPSVVQAKPPVHGTSAMRSDYGAFSAATVVAHERTPPGSPARQAGGRRQIPVITPPAGLDYGDFSAFTSAVTSFHRIASPVAGPPNGAFAASGGNDDDEYASFDSFVASGASFKAAPAAPASASSSDTYGAFEPFELSNVPLRPSPFVNADAAPRSTPVESSDDYGSFASLASVSSLASSERSAASSAAPPRPSAASSSNDVYGTFSLSPNLKSSVSAPVLAPPPLALTSRPPASLPSDTYGSFDSLSLADAPRGQPAPPAVVTAAPHSAPADMTPLETAVQDEPEVSALDELNGGMELYKQKRLDDALLRFIRAREAAQRAQDLVVEARALGNLGTVYLDKQNPQQAVLCYQQCLESMRTVQDVKRERLILNNLVLALMAAEDWVSAYNYCQVQLEATMSDVNRRKILTRMSELRERAARASREARAASGGISVGHAATP